MSGKFKSLLLLTFILCGMFMNLKPAKAVQEIKEVYLISSFLGESYGNIRRVYRLANDMKSQAKPFSAKRHRDRYRFEPGDKIPREIMSLSRKMAARFKMINGVLHQSDIQHRDVIFKEFSDTADNIATFCKRAIRANKDNNYALYLASAQGIEKEIQVGNDLLNDLELAINNSVAEFDARKENL